MGVVETPPSKGLACHDDCGCDFRSIRGVRVSNVREWIQLGVSSLTVLAIAAAVWQLVAQSRQMHREFEAMYVRRYWELMSNRSESWVLSGRLTVADRVVVRGYLQLSEDECDLRSLGRVTDGTWAFWARSIVDQCAARPYASELADLDRADYPRLRELLLDGPNHDPLTRSKRWRQRHGL